MSLRLNTIAFVFTTPPLVLLVLLLLLCLSFWLTWFISFLNCLSVFALRFLWVPFLNFVLVVVGCLPVLWFNCKWFFIVFAAAAAGVAVVAIVVGIVVNVVFNLVWCTMTLYYYSFLKR